MKDKIAWIGKNILFGFLFGLGAFIAVATADKIKRYNWNKGADCHTYQQESNDLEILGYTPILDQRVFKYSFKIKNNTSSSYSKVRVELNVYKNDFLVAECSTAVQELSANEERNTLDRCYDIIPENVTDAYKFEIKVSSYKK